MIQAVLFLVSTVFVFFGLGFKGAGEIEGNPSQIAIGYAAVGIGVDSPCSLSFGRRKIAAIQISALPPLHTYERTTGIDYTAAMLKYLRIAVTALSLTACVLLVALWVRSYRVYDDLIGHLSDTRLVTVDSVSGALSLSTSVWPSLPPPYTDYEPWKLNTFLLDEEGKTWFAGEDFDRNWAFYLAMPPNEESAVMVPHWFVALSAAVFAGAPWMRQLRWRFSLRTLLIATTLVAVGLCVIVLSR